VTTISEKSIKDTTSIRLLLKKHLEDFEVDKKLESVAKQLTNIALHYTMDETVSILHIIPVIPFILTTVHTPCT